MEAIMATLAAEEKRVIFPAMIDFFDSLARQVSLQALLP
jgi:hypothetical protein